MSQNQGYYKDPQYDEGRGAPGYPPQAMVIQQQPASNLDMDTDLTLLAPPSGGREWSSGTFDCFNDFSSCILTTLFGNCYMCYLSGKMGEGCCMPWCHPYALVNMRQKVRTAGDIEGNILMDCCCSVWCGACVLCQVKREMDYISGRQR